jgi:hypothetical protein
VTSTEVRPSTADAAGHLTAPGALLIGALAGGLIAQGGFYLPGRLIVIALTVAAAGWALVHTQFSADRWLTAAAGAVAAWTLVRAAAAGGNWPTAAAAVATAAVLIIGATLTGPGMVTSLTVIGVGVAVTGWAGVAFRLGIWAVPVEDRLWRAASTLTYPNAAAAVLAPLALLAVARLAARPDRARTVVAYLTVTGLGATLSRAGALAFAVGLVVLLAATAHRGRLVAPLLGAAVATAGLLPSVPVDQPVRPGWAVAALVAGLAVAAGPGLLPGRTGGVVVPVAALLVVLAVAVLAWPHLTGIVHSRVSLESGGRRGASGAALHLIAQRPWFGHGPGVAMYAWSDSTGGYLARFVHDEYLQTVVDLGLIGGLALLALLVAAVRAVWRARRPDPLWIGAAAGLVAFAVHSAFDFLWRPAALPLLAGILLGLAIHGEEEPSIGEENA